MSESVSDLNAELSSYTSANLEIPAELKAQIRAAARQRLVQEFHELKLAAQLNKQVGDNQRADELFTQAKKVIRMVEYIDTGIVD